MSGPAGRVVVVGSLNMDVVVTSDRVPARGETIVGNAITASPGGKGANQAVAASRAGVACVLIGAVGDDRDADVLLASLGDVDVSGVRRIAGASTGTALVQVAGGDNAITVIPGANARLAPEDITLVFAARDVVLAQREVPAATVAAAFERARAAGARTILNAAPAEGCPPSLLAAADVIVVNETELATLSGRPVPSVDEVAPAARALGATVVTTLGARGAVIVDGDEVTRIDALQVPVVDVTGAGDCFAGVLAARLVAGDSLIEAAATANRAAAICVGRPGAVPAMPTADEFA